MARNAGVETDDGVGMRAAHEHLRIRTTETLEFVDLTDQLAEAVGRSGVRTGVASVQTRHTTTAVVVNENEPLLLEDFREILDGFAPRERRYRHDDPALRAVNLQPGERRNGHAHCRAMLLGGSATLHVVDGRLDLGRWQRVLFVELDGPQERTVSIVVMGL